MSTQPDVTRVKVEHEYFIPVSKHKVRRRLIESIPDADDRQKFTDFCKLIEAIYHFEYHDTQEALKRDFCLFNSTTCQKELEGLSESEVEKAEEEFLTNFMTAMKKGNFTPLSQADYDTAEQEDFLFNLPVQIDLDKLDDELLPRYFAKHPYSEDGEPMPEFARRILIYRRGVGVEKVTGLLLTQKIDVLVNRVLRAIGSFFRGLVGKKALHEQTADLPITSTAAAEPQEKRDVIFEERYIDRITPRHVTKGLTSLFQRSTIQEPTFVQLVILFRYQTPPAKKGAAPPPKDRAIYIKTFRDIPMADLEVIFPEKKLSMKPLDLIKLCTTLLLGIGLVVYKIVTPDTHEPKGGNALMLGALTVLGGYFYKVYYAWQVARNRYEQLVTQSLYHKNLDNNSGVLYYLMDSLEEQEFKEAVLAYYFLWKDGPMDSATLDGKCEQYIKDAFDVEVNFEVDDALAKLEKEQLVSVENGVYTAKPLLEALETLDEKWDTYFMYNNDRQEREAAERQAIERVTAGIQAQGGAVLEDPSK